MSQKQKGKSVANNHHAVDTYNPMEIEKCAFYINRSKYILLYYQASRLKQMIEEIKMESIVHQKSVQEDIQRTMEKMQLKKMTTQTSYKQEQVEVNCKKKYHLCVKKVKQEKQKEAIEQQQCQALLSATWLLGLRSDIQLVSEPPTSNGRQFQQIRVEMQKNKILEKKVNVQSQYIISKEFQQQRYQKMIAELNLEEKHSVWDDKIDEQFECTYGYMSLGKQVNLEIKYYDFIKLNPHNYINDTIVNFFLRFTSINEVISKEVQFCTLIYNTYFCAKLVPYDKFSMNYYELHFIYQQMNSQLLKHIQWTKEDLFDKQYLVFPLHLKEHWSLCVIINPRSVCQQLLDREASDGLIVYFDSFMILNSKITFFLLLQKIPIFLTPSSYLINVFNMHSPTPLPQEQLFELVENNNIKIKQPLLPKQYNYVDCGLFLLEYTERFLTNPSYIIDNLDGRKLLRLFPCVMIFIKRILIKKVLHSLSIGSKDVAEMYKTTCQQINTLYDKQEQYDEIDEEITEMVQAKTQEQLLSIHLNVEYNFYYDA